MREAVADHLSASLARAGPDETLGTIAARLARSRATVELVCAVDEHGGLLGSLPVSGLFAHPPDTRLAKAMRTDVPAVRLGEDQEHAASLALHHGVDALPVVDAEGCALGVMPSQAILQVLRREHVEDLHVLAGIQRESSHARHAIEDPPLRRARHRLPWLLAGFAGAALATVAMASFESTLSRHLAVAFFVPGIVYLADAIGTQTETVAVRGLSLTHAGIGHLLAGELRTGMLMGACLGLVSFFPILAFLGDVRLAAAVATAIFAAGTVAAGLGMLLPWIIARSGRDPAFGSGPLATVIQDVVTLLVYFATVKAYGL